MQRTAFITGAGQGIGRIASLHLAGLGYRVMGVEKEEKAVAYMRAHHPEIACRQGDISQESEVEACFAWAAKEAGRLDALINNAGISRNQPLEKLTLEDWNTVLQTNLTGAFLCARAAAPLLRKQGRGSIVNICSTRAYMSEAHTEAYSASKGGLVALTHALAISLGPTIRVNSISPGWIDVTPHQVGGEAARLRPEDHAQHPAGRVGTPEDVARAIAFLLDPANDFITGQDFIVDGGMTRRMIYEH